MESCCNRKCCKEVMEDEQRMLYEHFQSASKVGQDGNDAISAYKK